MASDILAELPQSEPFATFLPQSPRQGYDLLTPIAVAVEKETVMSGLQRSALSVRKNAVTLPRLASAHRTLGFLARNDDGSLIIFGFFIFVLIFFACGMGPDHMRVETVRSTLQSTVERAALTAASLRRELPSEEVVNHHFDKAGLSRFRGPWNVAVDTSLRMRTRFVNLADPIPEASANRVAVINASRGKSHRRTLRRPSGEARQPE